jgi:hypothetical protein
MTKNKIYYGMMLVTLCVLVTIYGFEPLYFAGTTASRASGWYTFSCNEMITPFTLSMSGGRSSHYLPDTWNSRSSATDNALNLVLSESRPRPAQRIRFCPRPISGVILNEGAFSFEPIRIVPI